MFSVVSIGLFLSHFVRFRTVEYVILKISVSEVIFTLFSPFLAYLIVFCLKCYKVSTDFCIYFFGPMAFIYLVVWFRSNVLDSFLLPGFQMPALNKVCT